MLYNPDGEMVDSPLYTFAYDAANPPPPLPDDSRVSGVNGGGGEGGFKRRGPPVTDTDGYKRRGPPVTDEGFKRRGPPVREYPPVDPYRIAGYIGVKQASGEEGGAAVRPNYCTEGDLIKKPSS